MQRGKNVFTQLQFFFKDELVPIFQTLIDADIMYYKCIPAKIAIILQ